MTPRAAARSVSVIVPTIGRPESLRQMLESLCAQTVMVAEVLVADASGRDETAALVADPRWAARGLGVRHVAVTPPNAVRQRQAAIAQARGEYLLLLDDDVVLEPACVEGMVARLVGHSDVVAVMATFANQRWSRPTRLWAWYIERVLGIAADDWQGRVLGPLLRFGYDPLPGEASPVQWIGAGNSMVRRDAFVAAGGFSDFFLHRSTTNEDVDLGIKLSRVGRMLLAPDCRLTHNQAPSGRVTPRVAAEDDAYNRFMILRRTLGHSWWRSARLMLLYCVFESASDLASIGRGRAAGIASGRVWGRAVGFGRALAAGGA